MEGIFLAAIINTNVLFLKHSVIHSSRIAVLRKIRVFLPLSQCLLYYNAIIRPVLSYVSVIWSSCDKELLYRVLKLQKLAARVILYADLRTRS